MFSQNNSLKKGIIAIAVMLGGCAVTPPPRVVYVQSMPAQSRVVYAARAPQPVISVYVEPPLFEPLPIRVEWAPPPMLINTVPPMPFVGALWTGGYWVWEGDWVWAYGHWAQPPLPGYGWVNPYYENRGGSVVFVNGFWAAPGVMFIAPALSAHIAFAAVSIGAIPGPRAIGEPGVFVPAPPGSQLGLIVPAPIGTPPAVVTSAPPIVHVGMRINGSNNNSPTTINNSTTNVTVIAPASATASGQAFNASVYAQPHLATNFSSVVKAFAPEPVSTKSIPAYVAGRSLVSLPLAQAVHSELNAPTHPRTTAELAHIVPIEVPILSPQTASATLVSHFTSTAPAPIRPDAVKHANFNDKQPSVAKDQRVKLAKSAANSKPVAALENVNKKILNDKQKKKPEAKKGSVALLVLPHARLS